jgi:hypothetical protein
MFKWSCLAVAVVFLSVLTWMVNAVRQEVRRLPPPPVTLNGLVDLRQGATPDAITVPYRSPFAAPPRLTFPQGHDGWKITDERANSFSLNRSDPAAKVSNLIPWKAEGQPARTKLEEQNEAILQALQRLQSESAAQAVTRQAQNDALLRELQGLRQEVRKWLEGTGKK